MSENRPDPRKIAYLPIQELKADPRNPKAHDVETIGSSVGRFGFLEPVILDERTGYIISGHGRVKSITTMLDNGETAPEGVKVDADGVWRIPTVVGWSSRSDSEAAAALIALNRTTELGGWVDESLLELLEELEELDDAEAFVGVGFDEMGLDSLRHRIDEAETEDYLLDQYKSEPSDELGTEKVASKDILQPNIDLIYSSIDATSVRSLYAYLIGWYPGIITSSVSSARRYRDRFPNGVPIMFMDNEWHDYDHKQHIDALAEFTPKYGTVRDFLTKEQSEVSGVDYFSIQQTLDMAAEVAEHVDNVILIPKYDCIDKLPETINGKRVVLGYSVHSSYGGTPVPAERFKGRPVHLLGGSWKKQRALLHILKNDVVSLDNNNLMKIAQYSQVNQVGGSVVQLDEITGNSYAKRFDLSVILSLSNIMEDVRQMGAQVETESNTEIVNEVAEAVFREEGNE